MLLLELKTLRAGRLHFLIIHRFREPGTVCAAGEEVLSVDLIHRGRQYPLKMSCSQLLLFDYLARSRYAMTTSQIFAGMKADPFVQRHGANSTSQARLRKKIGRSCLKEYILRMRNAFGRAFRKAALNLDPYQVLVSEPTSSNQVCYRLRATVEWIHIDHPSIQRGGNGRLVSGIHQDSTPDPEPCDGWPFRRETPRAFVFKLMG